MYDSTVQPKRFTLSLSFISRIYVSALLYIRSHRHTLLRVAVIGGLLLMAPLVGIWITENDPLIILALSILPLVLIILHVVLPRLEWAPIIILVAGAFIPLSIGTGTESRLVDSLLLTMFFVGQWLLTMLIAEKRLSLRPSLTNKPLMAFIATVLVSLGWSMVLRDPLVNTWDTFLLVQSASAVVMIMLPGTFLLVAHRVNSLKLLKVMTVLMLIAGVGGILQQFNLSPIELVNDRGLFTMWITSVSVGLALFSSSLTWKVRSVLMLLAAGWIYLRFGQQITWVAGWLPSFVALGVLAFMRSKKLFVLLIVAGVIFIALNSDYYLGTVYQNENHESGQSRLAAWRFNWQVTGKHWLLGTGPAGYAAYYMSYFPNNAMASHSSYIDIIAQTGVIGLAFCLWFFLALAWEGYKLALRLKGRADFSEGLVNAALAGTVSCIVAMAFGDWLFPFAYTQSIAGFDYVVYSWLFMGTIPVLNHLTGHPASSAPSNG